MSQWRRIAIEEVPSCQSVIAHSDSPSLMWIRLYDELLAAYERGDTGKATVHEIYKFAILCEKGKHPEVIARDVWLFFHAVAGGFVVGIEVLRDDLPRRISTKEFVYWARATGLAEEQISEATKVFR